ncbi:MAG: hypothetical protein HOQ45_02955 [Nocardioidaceae bacterium]|nr:hypothetical protein [Nocardioidaceae bacterium]
MSAKSDRTAARKAVAAYHQAQLADLVAHVGSAIDRYRSDELDAFEVDQLIFQFSPRGEGALEVLQPRRCRDDGGSHSRTAAVGLVGAGRTKGAVTRHRSAESDPLTPRCER